MATQAKVLNHRFHADASYGYVDAPNSEPADADLNTSQIAVYGANAQPALKFKNASDAVRVVNLRQTVDVEIAAASVQTLNATPVTLIAAPGAGLYIDVHRIHWMLDHQGVDYDDAGAGEDLAVSYTNAAGDQVVNVVDHSGFGDASADAHAVVFGIDCVPVANAAVVAHLLVGEWYSAAGDGILRASIDYTIRTLDLGA